MELAPKLAASAQVRRCLARNWLAYALGRRVSDKEVSLREVDRRFAEAKLRLDELILAVVQSRAFTHAVAEQP